ncbi:structural maintenance of chromosomes protein 6-like isoform X2 [Sminthopsis crassicaudata]|uniref:structural maintenance of chromosomes protein 6-like isoform X2 n=1 Tax=Sminthopsis crassicaudata TaxID=9301 RepID=UPI003D68C461
MEVQGSEGGSILYSDKEWSALKSEEVPSLRILGEEVCSFPNTMDQKEKDHDSPAAPDEEPSTSSKPKSDLGEEQENIPIQSFPHEVAASLLGSEGTGIIQNIQLENFMCHAMLGPVKFGSNVNFVVGQRGKSALLTALVLGLGGKSLGSSLGLFVKDGETSANISITLCNTGDRAFKSELYGDSITVQRCISVSGSTSYKLKDQARNVVSSQETELTAMLDHFRIQVDNPSTILQQEMGRQFFQLRHDGDRYRFFLKTTGLEQRLAEHSQILERKAKSQHEIDQKKEQLEQLKNQGIAIENHIQKIVTLKENLEDLKHEMAWALVSESEKDLNDMISNVNAGDEVTVQLNEKLEASKASFTVTEKQYKTICENLQKLKEEAAALEPKCIEAKEETKSTDKAYYQAEAFYMSSQNELDNLDKIAELLQNKIENQKKCVELQEMKKQEKISTLKEKVKNFQDQEDSLVEDLKHLREAIEKDGKECSQIKKEESDVQQTLHQQQQQLTQWKEYKSNPLKRFGPQIPALLEAVDDAHRQGSFTFKPIGPLGACIRLRDPEFALAIESCLKDLLLAFFCDNHKDEQILQELMKRFYSLDSPQPQIIVSAFECEMYDLTDRAACHPEFPTVLTALEIDNTVVANTLIDKRGIESVLLIKSSSLAREVMQGQDPPKNCSRALTACGDEVFEQHYYSCKESRPTYLGDVETEIRHLEKEIDIKMAQLLAFQQQASSLETDVRKNQETVNHHYQHLKETKIRVGIMTLEISDLEEEDTSESIGLSVLKEDAQETKEEMKEIEGKMKVQKEKMENLRQLKIDAEQRYNDFKLKCNQVSEGIESLTEEENQTALEMNTKRQSVLHYEERLKQHLNFLQVKKEQLAMKKTEVEREIGLAKRICSERKEVTKSAFDLDIEISDLRKAIQTERYSFGSQEEIRKQYQEIKESCLKLDGRVKSLKRLIKLFDEAANHSSLIFQNYRKSVSLQCKLYFYSLISQWSFNGKMNLDHENETLALSICPEEEDISDSSDVQEFSGGRQSFLNFLFILTLWSVTEAPFRCLDVFDLYMDRNHRKLAMNMILKLAHSQQHHQFILFSPQSMRFLPSSPLIEILQMPDPEQEVIPLPVQAVDSEAEDDD